VQLDFDGVIAWLDGRAGHRMFVATQPNTERAGNTRLSVTGMLTRRRSDEITLLDPAPGRIEVYKIGDGTLVLLEGELVRADEAPLREGFPAILQLDCGETLVIIGAAPS